MLYQRFVLWLTGLIFLVFGLLFLLRPLESSALLELELTRPAAITEIRAFYGGLEIGLGIFIIACAVLRGGIQIGLWFVVLTLGSTGAGRIYGLFADGTTQATTLTYLGVELGLALLALVGLLFPAPRSG